jgi:hypothetical protein
MFISSLLSLALSVSAVADANEGDERCLAFFLLLENKPDQYWDAQLAKSGALYYAGRVSGRNPEMDLEAAIIRAASAAQNLSAAERAKCKASLQPIAKALHDGGTTINQK